MQLGVCIIDEEGLVPCQSACNSEGVSISEVMEGTVLCECACNSEGVSISEGMEGTLQDIL